MTRIAHRLHQGPLLVQRALYPEGDDMPHLYIVHPPGGVVGGDRLETLIELGPGAEALVTTPAAQKLYRSAGAESVIQNRLCVGERAALEWLPSETIVFGGARVNSSTLVSLDRDATFIGWEIGCFGRPSSGDDFRSGYLAQRLEIDREGQPLLIDSFRARGGSAFLEAPWGLRGHPVAATLCAVARPGTPVAEIAARIRPSLPVCADVFSSVTIVDDALLFRVLGRNVELVKAVLVQVWSELRPGLLGRRATEPRIWST